MKFVWLVGLTLFGYAVNTSAMTLQSYQRQEAVSSEKGEPDRSMAIIGLTGLRTGIADALNTLRASDGSLKTNGIQICAPKAADFSEELIRSAIDSAVKEQSKNGDAMPQFLQLNVTMVAVRGLEILFPCGTP